MNIKAASIVIAMASVFFLRVALAAPGTPIGGIIVKGGKNPGGQMLVLATTNTDGSFALEFVEGGEYKLVFEERAGTKFGERFKSGVQLEHAINAKEKSAGDSQEIAAKVSRHTPFHNMIENAQTIVVIPQGGGVIRGVLRSVNSSEIGHAAQRAINEPGLLFNSSPPKGSIKR